MFFTFINLRLFDEGAGSGADGSAATGAESQTQPQKIVYGKAPEAQETAAEGGAQKGAEERNFDEEFDKLIKGEYKDAYSKKVQKTINKRFAETKSLQEQLDSRNGVMEALATKYGVEASDVEGILKAINDDNAYWEQEAEKEGVPVEQYKRMKTLESQNASYIRAQQEAQARAAADATVAKWQAEAEEFRNIVPDFNLETEITENPDFVRLIQTGVGIKAAYNATHMDDILSGAMHKTAQTVAEKIAKGREAKAARPAENGTAAQNGVLYKTDVNKLTAADREEIARRAARGETIIF